MAYKWGFVGTGRIIPRFMDGLLQVEDAIPAAIYGRSLEKAQHWANEYGMQAYNDYDKFLDEADIDIMYMALTHPLHREFTCKCLERKIPVLCEKPMGPNAAHEKDIIDCAKKNDTFLMEGMWTRMFPVTKQVMQWIKEGRIGDVVAMNGTFSIKTKAEPGDRLFAPEAAGGTLLDIGIYLVSFAHLLFERSPQDIVTLANMGPFGTDDCTGIVFRYDKGEIATLLTCFKSEGRDAITIYGTDGMIEIFEDFWRPRQAKLTCRDGIVDFDCPRNYRDGSVYGADVSFRGDGYQFEVAHIHDCLDKGLKESPFITHQQSLDIITTCDRIRQQWGLVFPFEK
ncbi:MAG: Gfo/Idh/MocA family protein [Christensenellaceae bacterium]